MAGKSFADGCAELEKRVGGPGKLVGTCEVSQVYAHYQEQGLDLRHPRGGQAKYLHTTIFRDVARSMRTLAAAVTRGPDDLGEAMQQVMERWSDGVEELAPVEFYDLRRSGHPSTTSNGVTIHDRAPHQHRLTDEELAAKDKARGGHRYGA